MLAWHTRPVDDPTKLSNGKYLGFFAVFSICLYLFWSGACSYVNYIGDDKVTVLKNTQDLSFDAFGPIIIGF